MTLRTAFTELLGLRHPIALAPMGGSAGGALAAAVGNAGGLGLLGGGNGNRNWLERELPVVTGGTRGPWGVGFQSWAADRAVVERALEARPSAVMLSFGDPAPARRAGPRVRRDADHPGHQPGGGQAGAGPGRRRHRGAGHGSGRPRGPARLVHAARSCRSSPTWRRRCRCWRRAGSPTGGAWPPRWPSAPPGRWSAPGCRPPPRRSPTRGQEGDRRPGAARTPSAARSSTSPAARAWPREYTGRTLAPPLPRPVARPGRRARRQPAGVERLPARRGQRRVPAAAGVGQPGDRPHHRPAARGRGGREPGRAGRGGPGPGAWALARGPPGRRRGGPARPARFLLLS